MRWNKTSQSLLVIGQCLLVLNLNDVAIEVIGSLHEQNRNEIPNMQKNQKISSLIMDSQNTFFQIVF